MLVAFNSTAVAASGVVGEGARRQVAAQATDRQLRVAEATHAEVAQLSGNLHERAASDSAFQAQLLGLVGQVLAHQQQMLANTQQALAHQQTQATQSAAALGHQHLLAHQLGQLALQGAGAASAPVARSTDQNACTNRGGGARCAQGEGPGERLGAGPCAGTSQGVCAASPSLCPATPAATQPRHLARQAVCWLSQAELSASATADARRQRQRRTLQPRLCGQPSVSNERAIAGANHMGVDE